MPNLGAAWKSGCLRVARARLQQVCHSAQLAADVLGSVRHHGVFRGKPGCHDAAVLAPLVHRLEAVLHSDVKCKEHRIKSRLTAVDCKLHLLPAECDSMQSD